MILLFLLGFFFGTLFYWIFRNSFYQELREINQLAVTAQSPSWKAFLFIAWEQTKTYGLLWVLSSTPLKIPYIVWIILYKGFTNAFIFSFFIMEYGWYGIRLIVCYELPHGPVFLLIYLLTFAKIEKENHNKRLWLILVSLYVALMLACFLEIHFNIPWMKALSL